MNQPISAPSCFAAATVFSQDSDICKGCVAFTECAAASLETLAQIKHIINVDDLLKRHAAARKGAMIAMKETDDKAEAELPPGNIEPPLPVKPVARKTQVVNVTFEVSPDETQVLAKMAVKPREIALRMLKSNDVEGIRVALAEKRNYYATSGPSFLRVALSMLISGALTTKRTMRETFQTELGWTEGTAASHVGIALAILVGFRLVQEKHGEFTLTPETGK